MRNVTVADAAEMLGVSQEQVGRLLLRGELAGSKWGRSWMIHLNSVHRYKDLHPGRGRPFPPARAWKELADAQVHSIEDAKRLAISCRRRAQRLDVHIASFAQATFKEDPRVMLSGVDAASFHGGGVSVQPPIDFYVRARDVEALLNDYRIEIELSDQVSSQAVMRVLSELNPDIPFSKYVPELVALVDLVAEGDYRSANEVQHMQRLKWNSIPS